jgi:hypothetical protein
MSVDCAIGGHEQILGDDVLAACTFHPQHVPRVIDNNLFAWHHNVYARSAALGIGASQDRLAH